MADFQRHEFKSVTKYSGWWRGAFGPSLKCLTCLKAIQKSLKLHETVNLDTSNIGGAHFSWELCEPLLDAPDKHLLQLASQVCQQPFTGLVSFLCCDIFFRVKTGSLQQLPAGSDSHPTWTWEQLMCDGLTAVTD